MSWQIRETKAPGPREPSGEPGCGGACGGSFPCIRSGHPEFLVVEITVSEREVCAVLRGSPTVSVVLEHVCIFKTTTVMDQTLCPSFLDLEMPVVPSNHHQCPAGRSNDPCSNTRVPGSPRAYGA